MLLESYFTLCGPPDEDEAFDLVIVEAPVGCDAGVLPQYDVLDIAKYLFAFELVDRLFVRLLFGFWRIAAAVAAARTHLRFDLFRVGSGSRFPQFAACSRTLAIKTAACFLARDRENVFADEISYFPTVFARRLGAKT